MNLYLVAFLEGFSTLAVELLAIRLLIPVVGSSITLTGVVLSVILLALSLGYEYGGRLAQVNPQRVLALNLGLSATLYAWGLFLLPRFSEAWVAGVGLSWGLLLSATVALGLPVFLASCTLPLLVGLHAKQTRGQPLARSTGRLLMTSTLGSVAGGLLPPQLFGWIGVEGTAAVVVLLLGLAGLIALKPSDRPSRIYLCIGLAGPALVLPFLHPPSLYRLDSAYQRIEVSQEGSERRFYTNGQAASGLYWPSRQPSFSYMRQALRVLQKYPLKRALFVGAAGMVLPERLKRDRGVDTLSIDLDPAVYKAAQVLWGETLRGHFRVASARAFVGTCQPQQYDLVFLDTFSGSAPPPETLTLEYLAQAQRCGTRVMLNAIMDTKQKTAFAHSLLATAKAAWGQVYYLRTPMPGAKADNFLLSDQALEGFWPYLGEGVIYRDNQNTIDQDWLQILLGSDQ